MTARDACVITAMCEEDVCWLPQYLADLERLSLPFIMLLDRCSERTRGIVLSHRLCEMCVLRRTEEGEFDERCKQPIMHAATKLGFHYAITMDVDETFERDAGPKIAEIIASNKPLFDVRWLNVWGKDGSKLRVDGPFGSGHRVKFYNMHQYDWKFMQPTVNGAYSHTKQGKRVHIEHVSHPLVTLHWGLSTPELCEQHRRRWDRIYGRFAAGGKNPYGFWDYACNPSVTPELVANEYI